MNGEGGGIAVKLDLAPLGDLVGASFLHALCMPASICQVLLSLGTVRLASSRRVNWKAPCHLSLHTASYFENHIWHVVTPEVS